MQSIIKKKKIFKLGFAVRYHQKNRRPRLKYEFNLPNGTLTINTTKETIPFEDAIRIGARNNPKRGFLIISTLIGRHWPTKPSTMNHIMNMMADQIGNIETPVTFIGMAETAVGIGEGISAAWQKINNKKAWTLQTTRQKLPNKKPTLTIKEDHSHAAEHLIYTPYGKDCFTGHTIVIVDDECSTGKTFQNLEEKIRQEYPGVLDFQYVAIANWSNTPVLSLLEGTLSWKATPMIAPPLAAYHGLGKTIEDESPRNGLYGTRTEINSTVKVREDEKYLILGDGENGYAAFLLAKQIEEEGGEAYIQSITRSPVLIAGDIRTAHEFVDPLHSGAPMFAYNIDDFYDKVVIVSPKNNNHEKVLSGKIHCDSIEKVDI